MTRRDGRLRRVLPRFATVAPISLALFVAAVASCAGTTAGTKAAAPVTRAASFDFERGIGMVEGGYSDSIWLLISEPNLAVGESLTLFADEPDPDPTAPPAILAAAVAERLTRAPSVKMLADSTDVWYRLVAPAGALDCCIFGYAVRAPRSAFRAAGGRIEADLDGDGVLEHFQSCSGTEGIHPTVWSGEPLVGVQRWRRYYATGYDSEPTCPGALKSTGR